MSAVRNGIALSALGLALASCAGTQQFKAPPANVASAWSEIATNAPAQREDWWRALGDPTLDQLIVHAVSASPNMQSIAAKMVQARAQMGMSKADLFPLVGLSADTEADRVPPGIAQRLGIGQELLRDNFALHASWEPDFWGANHALAASDRQSFLASRSAYQAALVSLLGDVSSAYVNYRVLQARQDAAQGLLAAQMQLAERARSRHANGQSSAQDPAQAEVAMQQARDNLALIDSEVKLERHTLALLAGMTDAEIAPLVAQAAPIPRPPALPGAGLPRDLLRNRPDVLQAELTARAAFARLNYAKVIRYPSLSIGGTFGFSSSNVGTQSLGEVFA